MGTNAQQRYRRHGSEGCESDQRQAEPDDTALQRSATVGGHRGVPMGTGRAERRLGLPDARRSLPDRRAAPRRVTACPRGGAPSALV